jgi:hypothetical protein
VDTSKKLIRADHTHRTGILNWWLDPIWTVQIVVCPNCEVEHSMYITNIILKHAIYQCSACPALLLGKYEKAYYKLLWHGRK